jgi:hypothetical protein
MHCGLTLTDQAINPVVYTAVINFTESDLKRLDQLISKPEFRKATETWLAIRKWAEKHQSNLQ